MGFCKLLLLPLLSFFFLTSFLEADYLQELQECYVFEGDRHGDFQGDFIAVLSDGSAWKIHPGDREMFLRWNLNDVVHAEVRTTFYFFKREHKFALYNHYTNESARVMLLQHAEDSPIIIETQVYKTGTKIIPITWQDANGNVYITYHYRDIYEKKLYLSDNTVWILQDSKKFDHFNPGRTVYLGVHRHKDGFSYFLITGTEREAKWSWVVW